jgi:hypothetical protein
MAFTLLGVIALVLLVTVVIGLIAAIVLLAFSAKRHPEQGANPDYAPCGNCQELVPISATKCPHCGATLGS